MTTLDAVRVPTTLPGVEPGTTFADLGLPEAVLRQLGRSGIDRPFPIQAAVIPDALAGRDVAGRAPTGSGKTLGFGLPLVARLASATKRRPTALVLAPTRELAEQIMSELTPYARAMGHTATAVYGGVGYGNQRGALDRGCELVVACPGRLEDLLEMRAIDLRDVTTVVIDEADQMADMGFLPAVRRIVDRTDASRQVLLFSATLDGPVAALVSEYQRDPVRHEVGPKGPDVHAAHHAFWVAERTDRVETTASAVERLGSTIVFTRTRHGADRVARQLSKFGIAAEPIHGGRSQSQRDRALAAFKKGRAAALVATDVAARGIHVDNVAAVVHFDPPADAATYLHRSGRTARAGARGVVVSLVDAAGVRAAKTLQRGIGIDVPVGPPDVDALVLAVIESSLDGDAGPAPSLTEAPSPAAAPADAPAESWADRRPDVAPVDPGAAQGSVKFFHTGRGYGFIVPDDGGVDLFVHYSNIVTDGFKTLDTSARVAFTVSPGRRGPEAKQVQVLTA